jgi:dTDP-4-dehydrorhamnose reductase
MRIFVTGASGFVGSNLVHVFRDRHGADVVAPGHEHVDLTDAALVTRAVAASRPDAIVHAAIWNAPAALERDRARAWAGYVGATRNVTDAANAAGIPVVLVSTDWVFDGTQAPAAEGEPPNPVNAYGFLKAASELVVTERAGHGVVARIAAVQGVHRARASAPRAQDAGFGYFVAALVDTLRAGARFTVWDGEGLNALATPTLATDAGELIWRALELGVTGTLHCCGGEHADRLGLAHRAVAAFGLDADRLDVGPPPAGALPRGRVPRDTRLDATATAARLGVELPDLDTQLARLRAELDASPAAPMETITT